MKWYVFYKNSLYGGAVRRFDTKEQAEMFADLIGRKTLEVYIRHIKKGR